MNKIKDLPGFKSACKDMEKHLASQPWGVLSMIDTPKQVKVKKELDKLFDPIAYSKAVLPAAPWALKIFGTEFFGMKQHFHNVGIPHFGLMEARLATSGSETLITIPFNDIPGPTLKAKRSYLLNVGAEELKARRSFTKNTMGLILEFFFMW